MSGRPLRPGMDRHKVGETVADLLLDGAGVPVGLVAHGPVGEALLSGRGVDHAVEDPFDNGRRITGTATLRYDKSLETGVLFFRSSDKMDVDAAYQAMRKRLRKHGAPSREVARKLTFTWSVGGGSVSLSRYKDDDGMAVLHMAVKGRPAARGT